ncbi:hypothetical protein BDV33DRAFT_185795 [Aspergillus novoparasiticus]|uniref:Uncharacterized protein n=1 Tax=Aspergillus novoparasiticus TaxID=986946 RepID=A0A5N6E5V9_9EURO|nr:hypothetical protein BDV33DRAFT_185795 [Aspergillus novoparasiticus]
MGTIVNNPLSSGRAHAAMRAAAVLTTRGYEFLACCDFKKVDIVTKFMCKELVSGKRGYTSVRWLNSGGTK